MLLAVHQKDEAAFERHFAQLKPFYADARCVGGEPRNSSPPLRSIPNSLRLSPRPPSHLLSSPSPLEHRLVGLDLLRLLVQNRTAEFHTQLEVLPEEALASPHVRHALLLEQSLMEGAYNKVLAGAASPPDDSYAWFTAQLAATVRDEVAACCEAAYASLPLGNAQQLLRMESPAATLAFCQQVRARSGNAHSFHMITTHCALARFSARLDHPG